MSAIEEKKKGRVMRYSDWDVPVCRALWGYVSKRCYLSQDLKGVSAQRLGRGTCKALWMLLPASF